MRTRFDALTGDLFAVPVELSPAPGALDCGATVRQWLSELIRQARRSRPEIAEEMSVLTGKKITDHSLDSWTADSREGWRFPLEYLPAFEVATETHALTSRMADLRGCRVLVGEDVLDAEIGKLERMREEAGRRIRQLKQVIGGMQ